MSLDREITLLRNAATLDNITELSEYYDHFSDLLRKVQDQARFGSLGQTLTGHPLAKYLFTALTTGLRALNRSIESKQAVSKESLASIAKLAAIADVCIKYCTSQYPPDPAPIDGLLAGLQQDVVHCGLLDSFAATCSVFAAALNDQIHQRTDASHPDTASHPQPSSISAAAAAAAVGAADKSATDATAAVAVWNLFTLIEPLMSLWLELLLMHASTTQPAKDEGTEETVLYTHFTAQFLATIQPLCSWVMALLRHQISASGSASSVPKHSSSSSSQKHLISFKVDQVMHLLSITVATHVKHLYGSNNEGEDRTDDAEASVHDPAHKALISQILQCPSFQQLQLLNLAAIAGGMHKQQQGDSQAELLEAVAASSSSAGDSQRSQKLKIADLSARILQDLGLSTHQGEHYYTLISDAERGLIDCYGCQELLEATIRNVRRIYETSSCIPAISSDTSSGSNVIQYEAKLLAILLQLAAQLPLLEQLVQLLTLMETICSRVEQLCGSPSSQNPSAVAVAVAELGDGILAPLMLQVGPAVLHALRHPEDDHGMKTAAAVKWSAVVQLIASLKSSDGGLGLKWEDWDTWDDIVQQQPYTATAAAEVAFRAAAAAAAADSRVSYLMLQMTSCPFASVTKSTRELMEAGPVAANCSSSTKCLQCYKSNSMAAKPFSLIVTGIKFIQQHAKTAETLNFLGKDPGIIGPMMPAFDRALNALSAIQRFANAAAGTAEEGAYIASRTSGVAAIPWMHAASRVLHCCSQILLRLSVVEASASTVRAPMYTLFMTLLMRLTEPVQWCRELLVLLVDPSSYSGTGSSTCTREGPLAGVVSAKVLHKLHQLLTKTQLMLQEGTREVSEGMDQAPGGRAAVTMQWGKEVRTLCNKLSQQLQQNAAVLSAVFPTLLCCNNPGCSNMSGASELACVGSSKCSRCKAAGYCSRECQAEHWSQHKLVCSKIAAE